MSYVYGLGADSFTVDQASNPVLNHALVPYRAKPGYLRLVNSLTRAKDYAAAGFHVAVTRGLAGGCQDLASAFNGTGPASCSNPLFRGDLSAKWKSVASAYADAFSIGNLADSITGIKRANSLADLAFAAEGITPPKDPVTGQSEPPAIGPGKPGSDTGGLFGSMGEAGLPILAVAGLGAWYLWGGAGKGKKKRKGGKRRKARKGSRRKTRRSRRRR